MAIVVLQFDYTVAKRDPCEPVSNYSPERLWVFVKGVAMDTETIACTKPKRQRRG